MTRIAKRLGSPISSGPARIQAPDSSFSSTYALSTGCRTSRSQALRDLRPATLRHGPLPSSLARSPPSCGAACDSAGALVGLGSSCLGLPDDQIGELVYARPSDFESVLAPLGIV